MHRTRSPRHARARAGQRGVVAIIVGLSMVALVGFIGLALDGARLYLTKTETQNGSDACALAASYELTNAPAIAQASFERGATAGTSVARRNRVGFQGVDIAAGDVIVEFGSSLGAGGAWYTAANNPPADSIYVRCRIQRTGITPWFMQVLGFGNQEVRSLATATLAPSQSSCAVPMALCARGPAPDYGYTVGEWVEMSFSQTGGNTNYTGNFRWIDYNPGAATPGCSGNGAAEIGCLLAGAGQCSLPAPITGACTTSGNSSAMPGCVGQTGAINSLEADYNTRFGIYAGSRTPTAAPPDFAGYAYSPENWTPASNAYAGSAGTLPNFQAARDAHTALQTADGITYTPPLLSGGNPTVLNSGQLAASGADRRLVVVPIVDCAGFVGGGNQHAPIRAYACVLMLDPYRRTGNDVQSRLEYLGRSDVAGSPCATSGVAGNASSTGPLVPALVQ